MIHFKTGRACRRDHLNNFANVFLHVMDSLQLLCDSFYGYCSYSTVSIL